MVTRTMIPFAMRDGSAGTGRLQIRWPTRQLKAEGAIGRASGKRGPLSWRVSKLRGDAGLRDMSRTCSRPSSPYLRRGKAIPYRAERSAWGPRGRAHRKHAN
jgi:hypothetical protein